MNAVARLRAAMRRAIVGHVHIMAPLPDEDGYLAHNFISVDGVVYWPNDVFIAPEDWTTPRTGGVVIGQHSEH